MKLFEGEYKRRIRLHFDERNRRIIEAFAGEKRRFNTRGLLNSSETIRAIHKFLESELSESTTVIVDTAIDLIKGEKSVLDVDQLRFLCEKALSERKDEIEKLFLSSIRHIEEGLQNVAMLQSFISLEDSYLLQREEMLIRLSESIKQHKSKMKVGERKVGRQSWGDTLQDRWNRLELEYTGVFGAKVFWLSMLTLVPLAVQLKVPALGLELSVASVIYVLYHVIGIYTWMQVHHIRENPSLCTNEAIKKLDSLSKIIRPLSYVVIFLIVLTILAKVKIVFGDKVIALRMPDYTYHLLGVRVPHKSKTFKDWYGRRMKDG